MGNVVVAEFVSIDGVVEAPGGEPGYPHTGWVAKFQSAAQIQYKFEEVLAHEALLLGRKTYESFAGAWPSYKGDFADKMNSMPKYVASTTLAKADWNNTTVLKGDAIRAVAQLKRELSGDMLVHGSRTLVNALKRHDLVDEYRLMVFPIVLGSGMRLFEDTEDATTLRLVDTHRLDNGTAVLTYRPQRA
ncbi:MAG: dihydrofolate reductase [Rhizobiales bacterium]|nr:dihydrofolate reductase [Hyphomicrobiales bacterium]